MPTTRSQGLTANEVPEKAKEPRTRKKKSNNGAKRIEAQSPPDGVAESSLFKLPSELRTMIYRFALFTEEDIEVTESHGIPEPALLSVSKVVRSESYKVFYFEDTFSCMIEHYSPATMILACGKTSKSDPKIGIRAPKLMIFNEQRHWGNLVRWLHLCLQESHYACYAMSDNELAEHNVEYSAEERLLGGLFRFIVDDEERTKRRLD